MYKRSYFSRIILFSPAILLYTMLLLYPQAESMAFSLYRWDGVGQKEFIGLENFIMLIKDEVFINSIGNSLRMLFVDFLFQGIIAFVIAYILCTGLKGWKIFRFVYFMPVIISGTAVGTLWKFIYNGEFGILNKLLEALHLEFLIKSWVGDPEIARWAVAFPGAIQWLGFSIVIYMAAINNVNIDILESAKIDGVTGSKTLFLIIFPLIKDIVAINMIFMITGVLQSFDIVWMLTYGGPMDMTHTMATLSYSKIFRRSIVGYGSAITCFILFMSVAFSFLSKKLIKTDQQIYS